VLDFVEELFLVLALAHAFGPSVVVGAVSLFVGGGGAYGKTIFNREKGEGFEKKIFFFFTHVRSLPSTSTVVRLTIAYKYKNLMT
jgi:hypothetical protein